jgi:2-polyprenyl-3-methyl-5-hydroxy-6-metoxy-1,4-benzoquinol methylase
MRSPDRGIPKPGETASMSAREQLIQNYMTHYSRVNAGAIPVPSTKSTASMRLMYGPLLATLAPGSKVLDIGCGTGLLLSWLAQQPNLVPVGVDMSATQIQHARRTLPNVELVCSDGLSYLRRYPGTFAGIFCLDVIEHLPGLGLCFQWIQAARDALLPSGFFLCRVPNGANLVASYSRYLDLTHERCFTTPSLLQLLEGGGLQACSVLPLRAPHLSGRLRLTVEAMLHRAIFLVCGHGGERIFTNNVYAVGYKTAAF